MIEKDAFKWCEILKRLLDIVITMATCNLPFRGKRNENIKTVDTISGIVFGGEGSSRADKL